MVDNLTKKLKAYGADKYIPPVTLALCRQTMLDQGYDPEKHTPGDVFHGKKNARQHPRICMELRAAIHDHIASGQIPILGATDPPLGGWAWKPSDAAIHAFESKRRNEEPEEFANQMAHDIRVGSDNGNYKSEAGLEEGDDVEEDKDKGSEEDKRERATGEGRRPRNRRKQGGGNTRGRGKTREGRNEGGEEDQGGGKDDREGENKGLVRRQRGGNERDKGGDEEEGEDEWREEDKTSNKEDSRKDKDEED